MSSSYTGSGTISFGSGAEVTLTIPYSASGNLLLGDSSDVISTHYNYIGSGNLSFGNGAADITSSNWVFAASGGLSLDSGTISNTIFSPPANGIITFNGAADCRLILTYEASGSLSVGNTASAGIQFFLETVFTWDISQGVLRNWRVEGRQQPVNQPCPPTYNSDPGVSLVGNYMQFMVNIQAHSITDLCKRLKDRGLTGPLKKIQVWSLPVNKSDWASSDKVDCNKLSTIEFSNVPDCIDFTVDQELSVSATVSSSVILVKDYTYEASGSLSFNNNLNRPQVSYYAYVASGGLGFSNTFTVSSPQYYYYEASGNIGFNNSATYFGSDFGILSVSGKFSSELLNISAGFGTQSYDPLTANSNLVQVTCCTDLSVAQVLFVRHELFRSSTLSNFLSVNGLSLPRIFNLMFSQQRNSWYYNKQYKGSSTDETGDELWNIVFEFGCLVEDAVLGIPADVWGFSILVRKRNLNNSRINITRLVMEFDPSNVCDISGGLRFNFKFNPLDSSTDPVTIRTLTFVDELGIFKGSTYSSNPNTSFEVNMYAPNIGNGVLDQSRIFQNMLLGVR